MRAKDVIARALYYLALQMFRSLIMASARSILDTVSTLITEDTHLFILLSALTAAAVALITMRRW